MRATGPRAGAPRARAVSSRRRAARRPPRGAHAGTPETSPLRSIYITYDGIDTMTDDMFVLKWLMTALCWALTFPALYQTTLVTLTFVALAREKIFEELSQRRPPYITICLSLAMIVFLPFFLPILIITAPCIKQAKILEGVIDDENDLYLVLVGLIDFVQTLVLIPLGYVVIFASECPTDVFINIVVVQVFANLDDEFVRAFTEGPQGTKREALETYCQKVEEKKVEPTP